jgi:hypothetical protein
VWSQRSCLEAAWIWSPAEVISAKQPSSVFKRVAITTHSIVIKVGIQTYGCSGECGAYLRGRHRGFHLCWAPGDGQPDVAQATQLAATPGCQESSTPDSALPIYPVANSAGCTTCALSGAVSLAPLHLAHPAAALAACRHRCWKQHGVESWGERPAHPHEIVT